MVNFLDLPAELRLKIYDLTFRGAAIKFVCNLRDQNGLQLARATSASMLVCNKAIYQDSLPSFYKRVRLDVSEIIDEDTGALRSGDLPIPFDNGQVAHISLYHKLCDKVGIRKFIKSLTSLESLVYFGAGGYYEGDDLPSDKELTKEEENKWLLADVAGIVQYIPSILIGSCACEEELEECSDAPVRTLIAAWAWNEKPFRLIARLPMYRGYGFVLLGREAYVDLSASTVTVVDSLHPENVIGTTAIKLPY